MPLPASDTTTLWPPPAYADLYARMTQWAALYAGDLAAIQAAFGGAGTADQNGFFASDKGGFKATVGRTLQRFFLGTPTTPGQQNTKVPIPIAAEICQGATDMLYGEPFQVTVGRQDGDGRKGLKPQNPTEQRLQVLLDDRFFATVSDAAEIGAALSGSYLRVTWDPVVPDRPFTTYLTADVAIPEFKFGRLVAVTFSWVVRTEGDHFWRHLERHELAAGGVGVILHGLYQGDEGHLGIQVPLTDDPSTAALDLQTDLGYPGTITTGTPGLAVQYLPNIGPNRAWRTHPIGQYLGRSDLDGVEHLIDQLAEVMSAWLRAIRLAKARLFIAKRLTQTAGPGAGAVANLEQEAYVAVEMLGGGKDGSQGLSDLIHLEQPQVEFEQYQATAKALVEQILQMAGYSPHSFGVEDGQRGGARTATEVDSRDRRSDLTRSRKIRAQKPGIAEHIGKLLAVDNHLYGAGNVLDGIDVIFPEGTTESDLQIAQTILAAYQAESMSTQERVARLNKAWDDDQIQAEVKRLQDEFAAAPEPVFPPGMSGTMPTPTGGDGGDEPAAA